MRRRKLFCLALAVVLCLVVFAGCSTSSEKEQKKEKAEKETVQEVQVKEKSFESEDGRFYITADETWVDEGNTLEIPDAELTISQNGENHIVLIREYRYDFPEGLSQYNRMVVKNMENNIDHETTGKIEKIQLGDYDAYRTTITGETEGLDTEYIVYCAQVEDYYVQLICWNTADGKDMPAADFDKIARTLQPVDIEE